MLTLRINPVDFNTPWRWDFSGHAYLAGRSRITPFQHPALEHHLHSSGQGATTVVVRERRRVPRPARTAADDAPVVAVTTGPGRTVTLTTGPVCTTPLYATVGGAGDLYVSWDFTDTARQAPAARLHEVELARLLTLWLRYTPATLHAGVVRLTERATLTLDDGRLSIGLPGQADHYASRALRPGADVVTAFEDLLAEAITSRVYDPALSVVEVSGGVDSAQVALSLADLHPGQVTAAAVMLGGRVGEQQVMRRHMLVDGRFACDATVTAIEPLAPGGLRATGAAVSPYEDAYTEATTTMLHAATGGRPARCGPASEVTSSSRSLPANAQGRRSVMTGRLLHGCPSGSWMRWRGPMTTCLQPAW